MTSTRLNSSMRKINGILFFCVHSIPVWEPCTGRLGMATIIGRSCHKYNFCRDKCFVVCCDKLMFVMTKHVFCRDKSMLVVTKLLLLQVFVATNTCLSRQTFYRDKHTSVATKDVFCRDKHVIVATKLCLSREIFVVTGFVATKYFCRNKLFFFLATTILLSRLK